jgi:uncharacterized protein (TIGR00369 family)
MERKRIITWDDPQLNKRAALGSMSGLDYLKAIKEGTISPPPAARLIGYTVAEVDKGSVVFELQPREYHYNPFATVHGGILSTLLDTAMTASVLSTLPSGFSCSTIEIKVNFIKTVTAETGMVRCEARPIHSGKNLAFVEGRLKDGNDVLLAFGVSTCSIFQVA